MTWEAVYAGYDDPALTALTNPGLVRRATKLAASAVLAERGDSAGVVIVGDVQVRLDGRGPAHGRCPCPTAGVCVHVLAAAMTVRAHAPDDPGPQTPSRVESAPTDRPSDDGTASDRSTEPDSAEPDSTADLAPVIAEIVAQRPAALCRRAGIAAVRRAVRYHADVPVTVTGSARWVDIAWNGRSVRYVAGAGWDGMVSPTAADDRNSVHLEALARVFGLQGVPWTWPPGVETEDQPAPDGPTPATRALTTSVRDEIAATLTTGLSHLSPDAAERLADLALEVRLGGLPLLGSHVGTSAALLEGLAEHRDDATETEATSALARAWALSRALDVPLGPEPARTDRATESGEEHDGTERWARLRGAVRRTFDESPDSSTLHPLGATWWVTPTGARGITLTAWDADAGTVRTVTTARPAGTDPRFVRSPDVVAFWGATVPRLLAGPFRVDGPRIAADGALSPTARSVTCLPGGIDEAVVQEVCSSLVPGAPEVGFTGSDRPVALVPVSAFGELVVDEPAQQLVWSVSVTGSDDALVLRQEITPGTRHRVDTLLALDASRETRARTAYVLARRAVVRSRAVWEPTTVVLRKNGRLELFSLDFTHPPQPRSPSVLQRRWAMLSHRWENTRQVPAVVRPAVAVVCDDVRELVVDLTATGRLTPSTQQRQRCDDLARRCDDLALATLASSVRHLVAHPDVETLLRTHHVADRVATLAAAG